LFRLAFGLLVLVLLATSPAAAATPVVLRDGVDSYPLRGHSLDILEDPGGKLTINQVASPKMAGRFTPSRQPIPNFGFRTAAFWLRFTIDDHSRQPKQWLLQLDSPMMGVVDLYLPRSGDAFQVQRSGCLRPMSSREIRSRLIVLPLGAGPSPRTFYLRGRYQGHARFPLTILSRQAFEQKDRVSAYAFGAYTGILLAMSIYGLLLFFSLQDRNYLYYALLILSTLAAFLTLNGFLYEFLLPERPLSHEYAAMLTCILPILIAYIFARAFLQTDRLAPRHDRVMKYLIYFNLLLLPLMFLMPRASFRNLLNLNLLVAVFIKFTAAIICVRRGYHPARYYLAGRIVLWIFSLGFYLQNAGLASFGFPVLYLLMIGVVFDIIFLALALTDRINVVQQEKEQAEAEACRASQLAMLGELAAGIAHEVNTPINTIINTSDFLTDDNREELKHDAGIIKSEGRRIAGIVGSLLSFARRGQGDKTACPVAKIVADTVSLVQAKLKKEHILLSVEVPDDLPDVRANHQQMLQVALNLINNAAQALNDKYPEAHEDKIIRLRGEKVETEGGAMVRLTCHDHGPGIPARLLEQVMTPFFTTKPPGLGTGLGLSVAHGIIHEHGGSLRLTSIEGASTTVTIDLPAAEQASKLN
jgi:signal transduction histidine kinase